MRERTFNCLQSNKSQRLMQVIFVLILIAVTYAFFTQKPPRAPSTWDIAHLDKIVHAGLFFVLTAGLHVAFRVKIKIAATTLFLYGTLIEVFQHYIPNRGADWLDIVADMAGVLLFYLVLTAIKKYR